MFKESRAAAQTKARVVVAALREMKLPDAAKKIGNEPKKMLAYTAFPYRH